MDGFTFAVLLVIGIAIYFGANSDLVSAIGEDVAALMNSANWPTGDRVWDVCRAIAHAEGYDTNGAALHLNNPGDLSPGDEHGYATAGPAEFHGGSYVIHFASADDGWGALYTKISNIASGASRVYGADWTWAQIGQEYAADASWAAHVARNLGVEVTSTLRDYIGGEL